MSPGDLQRKIVRALRHGEFGFRGSFERGGYLSIDSLKEAFGGGEDVWSEAFRLDRRAKKTRLDYGRPGYLRALQGHSSDCGHSRTWPHRSMCPPLRTFSGRTANTSTTGQTSTWWRASWPTVCSQEADRAVASLTTSWWARCPRSGAMPAALGAGQTPWCSVTLRSWAEQGSGSSKERTVSSSRTQFHRKTIFRILSADNKRGAYTEVLAEIGTDRMLHLVRDFRAEAVEAAAAAMDDSATAAGSADVPGLAAPGEGAGADEARAVICRTRRPLQPPRPRGVVELRKRLVRSARRRHGRRHVRGCGFRPEPYHWGTR